jgi:hypothetical protein
MNEQGFVEGTRILIATHVSRLFFDSDTMGLNQKQFANPVFSFSVLAHMSKQAHYDRWK